jgi:hypothetical protein
MAKKRSFPIGAITCPCGRTLSPNMQTCRGCGADRPVYGPAPAKEGGVASPTSPPTSPTKVTAKTAKSPCNKDTPETASPCKKGAAEPENFFISTIKFKELPDD